MERKFPAGRHHDYEDAVAEGFAKLVAKGGPLENPRGYITTVAVKHHAPDVGQGRSRAAPGQRVGRQRRSRYWADPTADEAINDATFDFMGGIVETWESRNFQTATLLVLDAAKVGEPISSALRMLTSGAQPPTVKPHAQSLTRREQLTRPGMKLRAYLLAALTAALTCSLASVGDAAAVAPKKGAQFRGGVTPYLGFGDDNYGLFFLKVSRTGKSTSALGFIVNQRCYEGVRFKLIEGKIRIRRGRLRFANDYYWSDGRVRVHVRLNGRFATPVKARGTLRITGSSCIWPGLRHWFAVRERPAPRPRTGR